MSRALVVATTLVGVTAVAAPAAQARDRIYGGSTGAREPIVLHAAENGRLKSAVVAWEARCGDGQLFVDTGRQRVERPQPGFGGPGPNALTMSRNANGRFSGRQEAARDLGDRVATFTATIAGTLRRTSASGTLRAEVKIFNKADRAQVDTCRASVRWSASRRPGRVYGGVTSQREPVVVRVDAARRRVSDLLFGWDSQTCVPEGFFRLGDALTNFRVRGGRFGDTFSQTVPLNSGGQRKLDYDIRGRVSSLRASGTFTVRMADTGTANDGTCDTGRVTWSATTG